jgi:hypothetical protein
MSLIGDISSNVTLVAEKLSDYDDWLDKASPIFEMENRKLEVLCREHPKALVFYDKKLRELKVLEDIIQKKINEIESVHWKRYTEKYQRTLNNTDIKVYIKGEEDYKLMTEVLHEVNLVRQQYEAVVDALKQMGWTLNNIVKLRVAQLEMVEL